MPVLTPSHLSSKVHGKVFTAYVRSAMIYGSETLGPNHPNAPAAKTVPWSTGSVAPKTKTKHPQPHYSRNLALRVYISECGLAGVDPQNREARRAAAAAAAAAADDDDDAAAAAADDDDADDDDENCQKRIRAPKGCIIERHGILAAVGLLHSFDEDRSIHIHVHY